MEFFTGDALFQTHDNLEHLAMMESVCNGKLETKLIRQVQSSGRGNNANQAAKWVVSNVSVVQHADIIRYFTRGFKLDYPNPETTKASKKYVKAMKHLQVGPHRIPIDA